MLVDAHVVDGLELLAIQNLDDALDAVDPVLVPFDVSLFKLLVLNLDLLKALLGFEHPDKVVVQDLYSAIIIIILVLSFLRFELWQDIILETRLVLPDVNAVNLHLRQSVNRLQAHSITNEVFFEQ